MNRKIKSTTNTPTTFSCFIEVIQAEMSTMIKLAANRMILIEQNEE